MKRSGGLSDPSSNFNDDSGARRVLLLEVADLGCCDVLHFGVLDEPLLLGNSAVYGGQRGVIILSVLELSYVAPRDVRRIVVWCYVHPIFLLQCMRLLDMTGVAYPEIFRNSSAGTCISAFELD